MFHEHLTFLHAILFRLTKQLGLLPLCPHLLKTCLKRTCCQWTLIVIQALMCLAHHYCVMLQGAPVVWSPFANFPGSFPQENSMVKLSGKITSHVQALWALLLASHDFRAAWANLPLSPILPAPALSCLPTYHSPYLGFCFFPLKDPCILGLGKELWLLLPNIAATWNCSL